MRSSGKSIAVVVRCSRCGRPLTKPESVKRGFGDVCWKQIEVSLWEELAAQEPSPTGERFYHQLRQLPLPGM